MPYHDVGAHSTQVVLVVQVLSAPTSGAMGAPWNQQALCKLQSAPVALLNGPDTLPGSNNSTLLLYAALQDKSVHKYRLNISALLMPSKTKVPDGPSPMHQLLICAGTMTAAIL